MATITKPSPPVEQDSDSPPFPVRRFTVDEYHRLAEIGVLTEDDRVELLEGWIVPKMVKNPPHEGTIGIVEAALRARLPAGWIVRGQSAIATADSEPEPDLAVVHGELRTFVKRHPLPAEIAIIIEVADSTLKRDRFKCRMYARAAIPYYWIINLIDSQIEVYTDPTGPARSPKYRQRTDYRGEETVPVIIEGQEVARFVVSELLP